MEAGRLPCRRVSRGTLAIGDASCFEPIAAAYKRAKARRWWRQHLADVFQAIAKRDASPRGTR